MELLNRRNLEETIFKILMIASVLIVMGSLVIIIGLVIFNGGSSLTVEMFTQTSSGGYYLGRGGGILNAILGSLFLALPATALACLIGLGIAFMVIGGKNKDKW